MGERFAGKVFWITGGGSGLGAALAIAAAKEGAIIAISGRRKARLDEVIDALEHEGCKALGLPCDVTDPGQLQSCVEEIVSRFGAIDVAIANAGFAVSGQVLDHEPEDWQRQFDTNVIGATMTIRAAMPELLKTKGRAVLMSSVASMFTYPSGGAYCASKAALRAIGQALSIELHGTGVSCTTIHPGFVESEIGKVDNHGRFDPSRKDPRPAALLWKSDKAAKVMLKAIYKRRREFTFTAHGIIATWISRYAPSLAFRIATSDMASSKAGELTDGRAT